MDTINFILKNRVNKKATNKLTLDSCKRKNCSKAATLEAVIILKFTALSILLRSLSVIAETSFSFQRGTEESTESKNAYFPRFHAKYCMLLDLNVGKAEFYFC